MWRPRGFNVCFCLHWCLQGNQEASNPADMAQTYTPQYGHPPQNEFSATHTLPTQDYAGQNRVPDHGLALYTPAQTHSDLANADSNTPAISSGNNTAPVRQTHTHANRVLVSDVKIYFFKKSATFHLTILSFSHNSEIIFHKLDFNLTILRERKDKVVRYKRASLRRKVQTRSDFQTFFSLSSENKMSQNCKK